MNVDRKEQKLKDTAHHWQQAAASRRTENARLAGIERNSVNYVEYTERPSKRLSKRKERKSSMIEKEVELQTEDLDAAAAVRRKSMNATRISTSNQKAELCFHEPINVRFKSVSKEQ